MTVPRAGFRQIVSLGIMVGFGAAYFHDPSNPGFQSTIQNALVGVIAYWIGSSQGAHENRTELNEAHRKLTDKIGATNGQP